MRGPSVGEAALLATAFGSGEMLNELPEFFGRMANLAIVFDQGITALRMAFRVQKFRKRPLRWFAYS